MPSKKKKQRKKRKGRNVRKASKAKSEYEVLDRNIRGEPVNNQDKTEVNNIVPTGNLYDDEIPFLLRYQDLLDNIRFIESQAGIDLSNLKQRIIRKINYFVHVSKSADGFGIELVGTQQLRTQEHVRREDETYQEPGMKEQFLGMIENAEGIDPAEDFDNQPGTW